MKDAAIKKQNPPFKLTCLHSCHRIILQQFYAQNNSIAQKMKKISPKPFVL